MKNRIFLIGAAAVCAVAYLVSCAPQQQKQVEETKQDAGTAAIEIAWSVDADCSQCHEAEASSTVDVDCLAKLHVDEGATCVECHNEESALTEVHKESAGEAPAEKLARTKVSKEVCLSCHEHGSLETIAAQTADIAITDAQGKSVNPHALPLGKDHDALACVECHVSHESADALSEAESVCLSCHHSGVFECGTCHS